MNQGIVQIGITTRRKKSGRANFIGPASEARKMLDMYF
jgi:hypothetical protein